MAISRQKKAKDLEALIEKLKTSKAVVLTDYKGLSVEELNEVRNKLRDEGVEFKVIKNTLFGLAVKDAGIEFNVEELSGHPVAVAFGSGDEVTPAKVVYSFAKDKETFEIVSGILEGKKIDKEQVISLAKMPSREELLAQMLGSINAPVSNFVGVLHANLRSIVYVLNAVKDQKGQTS